MTAKDLKLMRIVTRADFDGVVCAVLLRNALAIDSPVHWVEPNEMQRGLVKVRPGDVIANLPYDPRCSLWFDHHYTNRLDQPFSGAFDLAPSAARVIYDHYRKRLGSGYEPLVAETDRIDAAQLSIDEILYPENYPYVLLSMTIRNRDPQDAPYWNRLVELLGSGSIQDAVADAQVYTRCQAVVEENRLYEKLLRTHTIQDGHVTITDFRTLSDSPTGNRFLVYSLFPESVVNVKVRFAQEDRGKLVVSVGHSILNRHCQVNVGLMLAQFEGGGHRGAGACSFSAEKVKDYLPRIIDILQVNRPNEPGD
jgi:oligoribonuclease NrnB/cAMP/cGMP phosphodiesterase (DHH superfamily)